MSRGCLGRLLASLALAGCSALHAQTVDDALPGPDSPYTARLARLASNWLVAGSAGEILPPVELTCLETANVDAYVGTLRRVVIQAPIETVEAVLNDIAHYREWMPGAVDVHVIPGSTSGNRFATSWEQRVPVFFLPNITYELSHVVDKSRTGVVIYRYKLRRSDMLLASDGIAILETLGPGRTRFTEYGFFRPRPSVVPASVIWQQSVKGAFRSAVSIKVRAENPGWSDGELSRESERLEESSSELVERCLADRHAHRLTQ